MWYPFIIDLPCKEHHGERQKCLRLTIFSLDQKNVNNVIQSGSWSGVTLSRVGSTSFTLPGIIQAVEYWNAANFVTWKADLADRVIKTKRISLVTWHDFHVKWITEKKLHRWQNNLNMVPNSLVLITITSLRWFQWFMLNGIDKNQTFS